jgi:hypothetical protein
MLWTIILIALVLWALGFFGGVGGSLIHLILVIAVVLLVVNLLSGRRSIV